MNNCIHCEHYRDESDSSVGHVDFTCLNPDGYYHQDIDDEVFGLSNDPDVNELCRKIGAICPEFSMLLTPESYNRSSSYPEGLYAEMGIYFN